MCFAVVQWLGGGPSVLVQAQHVVEVSERHSTNLSNVIPATQPSDSLTKVKMAFVPLLCYLNRPYPSITHRSGDLFINAAIVQLATYEIDITIEQPSFGQVGQCTNDEV